MNFENIWLISIVRIQTISIPLYLLLLNKFSVCSPYRHFLIIRRMSSKILSKKKRAFCLSIFLIMRGTGLICSQDGIFGNFVFFFFRDNVATIRLSAWSLQCDIFDGDTAAGPMPTLFSQEPDVTSQNILGNLAKAHNDLQRLTNVFFLMESVCQENCPALLKKPR